MDELISIIVPVYKVEKYLRRCLDSIKNQTYKNLEVILVDDGSPDNCPEICDEYAAKDSRFHVIHKENGGVSSARNAGLEYCVKNGGGYIGFVDSDDWLPLDGLSNLVQKSNKADLVCGNYATVVISGAKPRYLYVDDSLDNQLDGLLKIGALSTSWGKLYKKSIIIDAELRFPLGFSISEDTCFLYSFIKHCRTISTCVDKVYYYNQLNELSITKNYQEDFARCHYLTCKARVDIFPAGARLSEQEQLKILEFFVWSLRYYVERLPYKKAIDKIEKICKMYADVLSKIEMTNLSNLQSKHVRFYAQYKDFAAHNQYEELYKCLNSASGMPMTEKLKKIFKSAVRKALLPIETILIFRWNLFYK